MEKEKKLIEKSKQILKDLKREFFEDTFQIFPPQKILELNYNFDVDVWKVFVDVPDEQFGGQSPFSIYFKDENLEPFMFHDGGAEGRVPYLTITKENGKFSIGDIWNDE